MTNRKSVYQACPPHSHLQGEDDILVKAGPLLKIIPEWQEMLSTDLTEEEYKALRRHERSGRSLGSDDFITRLEKLTSRTLNKQKSGPKKNN